MTTPTEAARASGQTKDNMTTTATIYSIDDMLADESALALISEDQRRDGGYLCGEVWCVSMMDGRHEYVCNRPAGHLGPHHCSEHRSTWCVRE